MRKEFENKTEYSKTEIEKWFDYAKDTEIENNVVWINEPHHFEDVYAFLVQGSSKDLLIDTGMGIGKISNVLKQNRKSNKELIVVNTHWHFDHIGGNSEFEKVLVPNNSYEIKGIEKGWSKMEMSKYFFFDGFWHGGAPSFFNTESFGITGYTNTVKMPEEINLGNRIIIPIETPGHTPGSLSFFDSTNGLLFTGDLLYEGPLYAFEQESNPDDYLESLKIISKLQIKTIYPGHNHSTTKDFPNLINEAISLFEKAKNKEVWDADGEFSGTVEYQHPETKNGRRLKIIVNKHYVK